MSFVHSVLMGDPRHFSIKGGANPHTRTMLGFKKKVNRLLAIRQWHYLAKSLCQYGVQVFVIDPVAEHPGLVYPANAGFMDKVQSQISLNLKLNHKKFYLSNLLPTRAGEQVHYEAMLKGLGVETALLTKRFEGEADFFPVGNRYIFCSGALEKQRFKFHLGFPPYKRVFGFRSDSLILSELQKIVGEHEIVSLTLIDERFYHGDTLLCSFGVEKSQLMVYMNGLSKDSQDVCRHLFKDRLLEISDDDAKLYACNSFQTINEGNAYLFMPSGISQRLIDQIKERHVTPILIDVSEFLKKGGGSIKCMIGDLGFFPDSEHEISEKIKDFRQNHRYDNYYKNV